MMSCFSWGMSRKGRSDGGGGTSVQWDLVNTNLVNAIVTLVAYMLSERRLVMKMGTLNLNILRCVDMPSVEMEKEEGVREVEEEIEEGCGGGEGGS